MRTTSFLFFLLHLHVLNIPFISYRLSDLLQLVLSKGCPFRLKHYKNKNFPDTLLRQLILIFGSSNVFMLVYGRIKQTHSYLCCQMHFLSKHIGFIILFFIFQAGIHCKISVETAFGFVHFCGCEIKCAMCKFLRDCSCTFLTQLKDLLSSQPCRVKIVQLLLNIKFKTCFHVL